MTALPGRSSVLDRNSRETEVGVQVTDVQRIVGAAKDVSEGHSIRAMACHEGAFCLPKAGEMRIEWYRYGDLNPGILTENQVS